jgi:hypothetical protein
VESLNRGQCNGDFWLQCEKYENICLHIVSVIRHERKCLTKILTLHLYKSTLTYKIRLRKVCSILPVGVILLLAPGEDMLDVPFFSDEAWFHLSAHVGR